MSLEAPLPGESPQTRAIESSDSEGEGFMAAMRQLTGGG